MNTIYKLKPTWVILLMVVIGVVSCKKETLSDTRTINQMVDTTAVLLYKGSFTNGPYGSVTGDAKVYKQQGKLLLKLSNFNTSNGPDLHVYISKEIMPVTFINLGKIKSTNGNQLYEITGTPNFLEYKYICIHCVAYNHLFGSAAIK
jgi:hypothetical protein